MGSQDGRVALVTGGGRGVGRGISRLLAAEGAAVAVNYRRDQDAAQATVAEIVAAGGRAHAFQASVDDAEQCERLAAEVIAEFDGIDILVHNGGIASRGRNVADTDAAELLRVMATHALGPHALSRAVIPSMRTRGRGDIVMISSIATDNFTAGGAPYTMGKAAGEALALTLAKEERQYGIHVNIVAPGLVDTDMGERLAKSWGVDDIRTLDKVSPFGRVCTPNDVAEVVLWLCSAGAGYVTGQRIVVDGGGAKR